MNTDDKYDVAARRVLGTLAELGFEPSQSDPSGEGSDKWESAIAAVLDDFFDGAGIVSFKEVGEKLLPVLENFERGFGEEEQAEAQEIAVAALIREAFAA